MQNKLFRIVLTGGMCAGKTTSLSHITERFRDLGFNVYVVPETATSLILGGVNLNDPENVYHNHVSLLKIQMMMEQTFTDIARRSGKDSIVICDRGTMDASAFLDPSLWQAILDENGWGIVDLRDKHYDAVIHLVSASVGAKEFYTLENNAARSESAEQAAIIDAKIQNAWVGHPHLRVIDNSTDFAGKINRVLKAISNVVGIPDPIENERKFLVETAEIPNDIKTVSVNIEQTYLTSDQGMERVRKRGHNGNFTYTHTIKKFLGPGKNIELEKMISGREYLSLLKKADPERNVIKKQRTCFLWKNQYFELDQFISPVKEMILELEIEEDETVVRVPEFFKIKKEVTDDPAFSNYELARKVNIL